MSNLDSTWLAVFADDSPVMGMGDAEADTAPEAVCRAALSALAPTPETP